PPKASGFRQRRQLVHSLRTVPARRRTSASEEKSAGRDLLGWSDANTLRAKKFLHFAIIRARSVGYGRNPDQVFRVSIWTGKGVLALSAGAGLILWAFFLIHPSYRLRARPPCPA